MNKHEKEQALYQLDFATAACRQAFAAAIMDRNEPAALQAATRWRENVEVRRRVRRASAVRPGSRAHASKP